MASDKTQKRKEQAAKKISLQERRKRALDLRKAGATYQTIADKNGVSYSQAYKDVQHSLKGITRESAEDVLTLELERLDRLFLTHYANAIQGDTSSARIALQIMDRRSRYFGLDQSSATSNSNAVTAALLGFLQVAEEEHGNNDTGDGQVPQ